MHEVCTYACSTRASRARKKAWSHLRQLKHHLVAQAGQVDRQLDDLRQVLPHEPEALLDQPLHLQEVRRDEDRHRQGHLTRAKKEEEIRENRGGFHEHTAARMDTATAVARQRWRDARSIAR